eukprot:7379964-Heterocapsa_arctica.AAC.1
MGEGPLRGLDAALEHPRRRSDGAGRGQAAVPPSAAADEPDAEGAAAARPRLRAVAEEPPAPDHERLPPGQRHGQAAYAT